MARGTRGHIKHEGSEEDLDLVEPRVIRSRRRSSTPRSLQKVTVPSNRDKQTSTYVKVRLADARRSLEEDDAEFRKQKHNRNRKTKTKRKRK